jgi:hypothetical protein
VPIAIAAKPAAADVRGHKAVRACAHVAVVTHVIVAIASVG